MNPPTPPASPPRDVSPDAERWRRLKELFHAALDRPPAERSGLLASLPEEDLDLAPELRSLLQAHDAGGEFLEQVVAGEELELRAQAERERRIGQRVGSYRLLRLLGAGGMGEVYLAERADGTVERRVAIKLIRPGAHSAEILERFRTERQTLASLDHANIAGLLDAGATADGLPYYVMELVEGEPIDSWCDSRKLGIDGRLELFRKVCDAVAHAHRNLVVHRDLKPGNILVTAQGEPKLLDFGIAKLIGKDAEAATLLLTRSHHLVATPAYASPEQMAGGAITTATDVYLLGVNLYRLLTGHHPYAFASNNPVDMARVIATTEPIKPSTVVVTGNPAAPPDPSTQATQRQASPANEAPEAPDSKVGFAAEVAAAELAALAAARGETPERLRRRLAGDLDRIVLEALRKEPTRRYGSVEQLAEDLRRHLAGLPIRARPDTLGYRMDKFVRRHRVAVAAGALASMTLCGGLFAMVRQARLAELERQTAERRFAEVRKLANGLIFDVSDAVAALPGASVAQQRLVAHALVYLDALAAESSGHAELQAELAAGYQRVGDLLGHPQRPNLGDPDGALASYRKALAQRRTISAGAPFAAPTWSTLAAQNLELADVLQALGDTATANLAEESAARERERAAAAAAILAPADD